MHLNAKEKRPNPSKAITVAFKVNDLPHSVFHSLNGTYKRCMQNMEDCSLGNTQSQSATVPGENSSFLVALSHSQPDEAYQRAALAYS